MGSDFPGLELKIIEKCDLESEIYHGLIFIRLFLLLEDRVVDFIVICHNSLKSSIPIYV